MNEPNKPEINPKVNRAEGQEGQKEDQKNGLAALLAKFGLGGSASAGAGAGAGGIVSGGLLASKTGVLALVLIGTTVAGGIGVMGYKIFGNDSPAGLTGEEGFNSPFAARPQEQSAPGADSRGWAAGNKGASASLQYLVDANKTAPEAKADSGSSLAPASVGVRPAPTAQRASPSYAASAAAPKLGSKLGGALSGLGAASGGGGGGSSSGSGSNAAAANFSAGSRAGKISAMSGQNQARFGGSGASGRRFAGSTRAMARLVLGDQSGSSSRETGAQYDGGRKALGSGMESGTALGGGGGAGGKGKASPNASPNPERAGQNSGEKEIPPVEGKDVSPWKATLDLGKMLLTAGMMLLMLAGAFSKLAKTTAPPYSGYWLAASKVVAVLAGLCGLAAVACGVYAMTLGLKFPNALYYLGGGALVVVGAARVYFDDKAGEDTKTGVDQTAKEAGAESNARLAGKPGGENMR